MFGAHTEKFVFEKKMIFVKLRDSEVEKLQKKVLGAPPHQLSDGAGQPQA